jgi:hypothetical protein
MALTDLQPDEILIIGRALAALAEGELIEAWEFHSRLGIDLDHFRTMLSSWPNWDDSENHSLERLAINNALNELVNGVHVKENISQDVFGVDGEELANIYERWASS